MYGLPLECKALIKRLATKRLRQCIRPVCGVNSRLALMESARIGPHKAFGHEDRFFSQANHAPVNDCAISS